MGRIRYVVATSLDGYVAGPNGEAHWIVRDPDIGFAALWAQFDTCSWAAALTRLRCGAPARYSLLRPGRQSFSGGGYPVRKL
jgi:hypothetical protein